MDKMDQYAKTQLAKAVVQQAVDQCDEIENSLEGCLMVLQKIRVPFTITDDNVESKRGLCEKRSYTVCVGKKSPDLIEINDDDEFIENSVDSLVRFAGQKLENILRTQESILQRLDIVEEKMCKKYKEEVGIISDQQIDSNLD